MDIHKYKHIHICAYIYNYTYIHIHLIIYTYMRRLHHSPREPCDARWRCIFAWSAARTLAGLLPRPYRVTKPASYGSQELSFGPSYIKWRIDAKSELNMECLWVNMMIGSKLCLAENRKLARSKWGAGIDTPKYSGIRKMSEVVVRVNNAWAK